MYILEVHDLAIGYDNMVVMKDINFNLEKGSYLAVIGENGAGKSTLMKTLIKIIKPISGEIKINTNGSGTIGYLPQQKTINNDFPASVFEVVLSGFVGKHKFVPFYSKEEKELALKNLELVGALDLKKRCFRELSGGQQQRVLLARALCATNEILLLDEPSTGLSYEATKEMYDLIEKLNKDGLTVIMISHDLDNIGKYATNILEFTTTNVLFREGVRHV